MKILFLPHCLRRSEVCQAISGEMGLECKLDGNPHEGCSIPGLRDYALGLGYDVVIASGPSMVQKVLEDRNYKFVVGVACQCEVEAAERYLKVPHTSIQLLKDGCHNTEVDEEEVKEVLKNGKI